MRVTAKLWFLVAVIGQLAFAFYIVSFYGRAALQRDWQSWNKFMPHGYVPGHPMGNFAVALHLVFAVLIIAGGALQLVPQIRERAPSFHRWNGRIYMLSAFAISIGGLYMIWFRETIGDVFQHLGISLNAILIMICAFFTLRYALARKLAAHRRWALRLFMVVSGVWFFRVALMLWVFFNNAPAGFDPKNGPAGMDPKIFQSPFLTFWSFAQYLLPLAVLELYLHTRDRGGTPSRIAMAAGLLVLTLLMGFGIFRATMGVWLAQI